MTIAGCAGGYPRADSAASCYLIEAEGFRLVMDLGNGGLGALARYVSLDDVDAVWLSHLHGDHCLDMCVFAVYRQYHPDGPRRRIPVYGPAGTDQRLALGCRAVPPGVSAAAPDAPLSELFDFVTLEPGTSEIGPLRLTMARMSHPVETFGARVAHQGRVIAYSADTGPCDALGTLAQGADVLLCEATFPSAPGLPADLHLTAAQAAEHAAAAGAGELVLTHLAGWNDSERAMDEAAGLFDGPVTLAVPGGRI